MNIESDLVDLSSDHPERIEAAIIRLGESGNPKAVAPLVRALHRLSSHPELKALACDALGELSDLRATQALLSQLRDPHSEVRESAFTALFEIGQRRAHAMPDAAQWEQGFADPTEALTQIAWRTDHEAVLLLLKSLEGDDSQVKVGALYTLGQLGFMGAIEQIAQALGDQEDEVAAAAAYALGELARQGSPKTATWVCSTLYNAWNRAQFGYAPLGLECQIQVIRALAECVHPDDPSRGERAQQLAELYASALSHQEHVIRQLATIGLGRLGDLRAIPLLFTCLGDPEIGVRRNAVYAMGSLQSPEAPPLLIQQATNQPSEVKMAMAWALRRAPRSATLQAINLSAVSPDPSLRAVSAYFSGKLRFPDTLRTALKDPSWEVRKAAALAAGDAQAHGLIDLLIAALDDEEWRVRVAVIEGLKRLDASQSIDHLQQRTLEESHPVVQNALRSVIASFSVH